MRLLSRERIGSRALEIFHGSVWSYIALILSEISKRFKGFIVKCTLAKVVGNELQK